MFCQIGCLRLGPNPSVHPHFPIDFLLFETEFPGPQKYHMLMVSCIVSYPILSPFHSILSPISHRSYGV